MSRLQKILLSLILLVIAALILLTWGSLGSVILILSLLMAIGYILLNRFLDTRSTDDFQMED